jgi:menaquinone-dependent protoporphyrinogen oxidase
MERQSSRVLVCYATGTGCTKGVAERIAEALTRAGLVTDVAQFAQAADPRAYDAIVAGSGTRAGSWHPVAKKWMVCNAPALKSRPLALFTVGIAMADRPEKESETLGVTDRLLERTGLRPLGIGAFAGWYDPGKFNYLERKIMGIAKAPVGDFRDWEAIEAWATRVAGTLTTARGSANRSGSALS